MHLFALTAKTTLQEIVSLFHKVVLTTLSILFCRLWLDIPPEGSAVHSVHSPLVIIWHKDNANVENIYW